MPTASRGEGNPGDWAPALVPLGSLPSQRMLRTRCSPGMTVGPIGKTSPRVPLRRTLAGPTLKGAGEDAGIGEADQIRRLVDRDLLAVEIVQRHAVAQIVEQLFVARAFLAQLAVERGAAQAHPPGDRVHAEIARVQDGDEKPLNA